VSVSEQQLQDFVLNLPQIVPESLCLQCKICCRFPDTEKVQTPFWAPFEAKWAKPKVPEGSSWFRQEPDSPSLSPQLVSCGGGVRCPAFEPETNGCRIHSVKPLDCRLYPFVLTRNPGETEVLLAMDAKCPFIEQQGSDPELLAYAAQLTQTLDGEVGLEYLKQNPRIVGPSWPEYLSVAALPAATAWIQGRSEHPALPHPVLQPFRQENLPLLRRALAARDHVASHYTVAALLGWSDLLRLWWAPLENEGLALFAQQAGGLFMPVPPLGSRLVSSQIAKTWEILREANRGAEVSRVEGIEPQELPLFEQMGFSLRAEEEEYLYLSSTLIHLRGDPYRSQRWAINRCARTLSFEIRPFREKDLLPCLQLYTRWAIRRQRLSSEEIERRMLRDSLFFHRRLMMDRDSLGLLGRVLVSKGKVLAYTFGAPVSRETFSVFLEISEEAVPGLAQTLFREFCREIEASGYRWINGMGGCGLDRLCRAKQAYRPAKMAATFTACEKVK